MIYLYSIFIIIYDDCVNKLNRLDSENWLFTLFLFYHCTVSDYDMFTADKCYEKYN